MAESKLDVTPLVDLLGTTLHKHGENNVLDTIETKTLKGKHVMLYFSAHWCPPCRQFTPVLAKWYTDFKATGAEFELVFVSSDRDQEQFDEYWGTHPWLALPFSDRNLKNQLSSKFKVEGIPTLVVVNPEGELVTNKGRVQVVKDPTGADFPWTPKSLSEVLDGQLVDKDLNNSTVADAKAAPYIGLYFSAHWCPPCRQFTPILAKAYEKLNATEKTLEIIFVSGDQQAGQYSEYLSSMPWKAIPFADEARRNALNEHFEVNGIPSLVLLKSSGEVLTDSGVGFIREDPDCVNFPFIRPLMKLSGGTASMLNTDPMLLTFVDPADKDAQIAAMQTVADEFDAKFQEAKKEPPLRFLYAVDHPIIDQLGSVLGLELKANTSTSRPLTILLDVPSGQKHVITKPFSEESLRTTVAAFLEGSLETEGLRG